LFQIRIATNGLRYFIAVHPRKTNIDEHDVGHVRSRCRDCRPTILDDAHVMTEQLENHHQAVGDDGTVFHHQHASRMWLDRSSA
jgi:hypothetical protein